MKPQALFSIAYALGLAAVLWVAGTSVDGNPLVLVMTLVIGVVYTVGTLELRRHGTQTLDLIQALSRSETAPSDLSVWLEQVPEPLRPSVRLRIQGDRVAPPGPVLTPYLVGLLVMLGMLGTFLGMVVTLSGTAFALQSLTDIQGIRGAFSEPIKGLGLAFGASVAGVATSAMLGFMSTLTRRERLMAWRQIDALSHGPWRALNHPHQSQQVWANLQANTQALPQLVERMGRWMDRVESLQTQFNTQWLTQQERHQREIGQIHQTLAAQVEQSVSQHLSRSIEHTTEQLRALATDAMGQLVTQTEQVHRSLANAHADLLQSQQTQSQLHLDRVEAQLVQHLGQLGVALEAPLTRLIDISSQAPQAAAEVIGELRQRINASMARDNELLAERAQTLDHLAQLSQTLGQQVQRQGEDMGQLSAQLRASAIEVASLGVSFDAAVQVLHQNQDQVLDRLQQMASALAQSSTRSDEQMAYYVAQAREVIELSVAAQKPMLESLERVSRRLAPEENA